MLAGFEPFEHVRMRAMLTFERVIDLFDKGIMRQIVLDDDSGHEREEYEREKARPRLGSME